jgi:ribosomal protein S18 acetylase RimI-like enzyme
MWRVRNPETSESSTVSELVLQSDCGTLPALFGTNVKALVSHLQTVPSNPYSIENTLVVVDEADPHRVVGAFVGSTAHAMRRAQLRTAAHLLRWYGPGFIFRIPRLIRTSRSLSSLRSDDFYLSHIAVLPESRGHGAGRVLLLEGEKWAAAKGALRMTLDVELHNEGAQSFYEREGYRADSDVRIDLRGRGAFYFHRMVKDL